VMCAKKSLLNRVKRTGVEVFVEIGNAFLGNSVEAAMHPVKQSILREFTATLTGVLADWPAFGLNGRRRQVPVLPDKFENPIIGRNHPVCLLAHLVTVSRCITHRATDEKQFATLVLQSTHNR